MKTQKGITLIALIITIIVMLILVGVSVSVALNTGLFKTAQGVAKNTQAERINETKLSEGKVTIGGIEYYSLEDYANRGVGLDNLLDDYDIKEGYLNGGGRLSANTNGNYITITVNPGEYYGIWYQEDCNFYRADRGGVIQFDTDNNPGTLMDDSAASNEMAACAVDMATLISANINTASEDNGVIVKVPDDATKMHLNLRYNGDKFDCTKTAVIVKLNEDYFNNKIKMITIGDSITEFNSHTNKNWSIYARNNLNALHINYAVTNNGYVATGSSKNTNFKNQYEKAIGELKNNILSPNLIVFYGSFNDMRLVESGTTSIGEKINGEWTENSLAASMKNAYEVVGENFPNAKIVVISPLPWLTDESAHNDENSNESKYVAVMQQICEEKGIPFLNLYGKQNFLEPWLAGNDIYYKEDGVHLVDAGHEKLAPVIINFLREHKP